MAIQKKHGKGRLDKYYKLAKEKGYRARAAFKLIQLNKKYGFLEQSKVVIDLCAAPGSWLQVCSEIMPRSSLIVGCDLSPIKPIPGVISFTSDIRSPECRATLRQHLKTWKADTVIHDGAPNVGTAWVQDSFNQVELALQSLKLATEFLRSGGVFVSKVFRSKEYNSFLWVLNQLFTKVDATSPPASRQVSAEIFVVCRGYKCPKKLDPRLLDPKYVFAELQDPTPNNEAKVYNPEVKKRKRDGYEEGDFTQFKEMAASEFIQTTDPIAVLGSYNRLSFEQPPNGDVALAALDKLPETTDEIRNCCSDLRVLGRKDFKLLLKWRLKMRDIFQLKTPQAATVEESEEVAEVESMDEELKIQEELQNMKDRENTKRKREKRKENERKQREVVRMQLNMSTPFDIGLEESGPIGEGAMFSLKKVDKTDAMRRLNRGKMVVPTQAPQKEADSGLGSSGETDDESDAEEDRLERELESMYDQYKERKAEVDAKYRAKKARKNFGDDEWDGLSGEEADEKDESSELEEDDSSSDEDEAPTEGLIRDLDSSKGANGLSKRATAFFNQDIFSGISGILPEQEDAAEDSADEEVNRDAAAIVAQQAKNRKAEAPAKPTKTEAAVVDSDSEMEDNEDGFEVVKRNEDDDWDKDTRRADGRPDIDIITAEAMSLAHQLATGQKTTYDAIDDGYNKYAFRDRDGLPDWFVEDESRHDKLQKPISKAAAQAIKEKMRAFNARPIKKVREAKARKKFKAAQKLEKLKKKSELLNNDENMTEKEKADSISRLISKAAKKPKKQQAKLVVARGLNRGIKGRPKGIKGRYRIVDPRMKKELRAQKRISKKKK
ncbi:AdoMet-dependent rRNA methyltransferase SPB1 [Fusarium oxysporum f. sp. rapae]|uniref:AdoMet-dependent rRNA methyltransferase SPB1 n=1 Tax=Fusarium oxysporum f. sp. rapae TaxID=485398 RepID=A0A8J5UCB1_FUSOX|nr:AdoMet-dependent rRNA methyltransferase SPB1 [Fusarium oxysporum f. sp. rapae]